MAEIIVSPNYGVRIQDANMNPEFLLNLLEEKIPASDLFALDVESEEGNAIIFLSRAEYMYELIQDGIKSGIKTLNTLPLISQYTISNVYPFFTNSFLYELFSNFGTVLKIECTTVHSDNIKCSHVMSGRRLITFLLPVHYPEIILPNCVETKIGVLLSVEKHCCACFHDGHSMLECAELNNWYTAKNNVGSVCLRRNESEPGNVTSNVYSSDSDTSTVDYSPDICVGYRAPNHQASSNTDEDQSLRENCSSNMRWKFTSGLAVLQKANCHKYLDLLLQDSYSVTKHASKIVRKYKQMGAIKRHKRLSVTSSYKSYQFQEKTSKVCSRIKINFKNDSKMEKYTKHSSEIESSTSINTTINSLNNETENILPNSNQIENILDSSEDENIHLDSDQIEKLGSSNAPQKNCDLENMPIVTDDSEKEGSCEKFVSSCDPTRKNLFFCEEDSDSSVSSSSSLPSLNTILKKALRSTQKC